MKNVIGLMVLAIMTTSCVNLTGNLQVSQTMTAKKKGGFLNLQKKDVKIEPGMYLSELKINNESSFTLKLKAQKEDDSDIQIPFTSEESFNIPTNGPVSIKGSTVSQPFDLKGDIQTLISYSDTYNTTESCTFTVQERRCDKVCTTPPAPAPNRDAPPSRDGGGREPRGPAPAPRCDVVCRMVPVSYTGSHWVEYFYKYTDRKLAANIVAENTDNVLATFTGSSHDSDRINQNVGECR